MTAAVAHTGIAAMTLRRRVDAWISHDPERIASGYAIKGARVYGGRLVDEVDAERARLQHAVLLDTGVSAEQWAGMVWFGTFPSGLGGHLTTASWWQAAMQRLRNQPPPASGDVALM